MTIQRETTEAKAPRVSERCQPKVMVRVAGRVESQREKRLAIILPMSANKWAASVMMAKLCAKYPPTTSPAMKMKHTMQAAYSCLRACALSGERPD